MAWKPKTVIGIVSVWGHIPDLGTSEEKENMDRAWPGVLTPHAHQVDLHMCHPSRA